ncbi:hypothetical protein Taro_051543 [Colocasia esculenta]|uniref:Uncharacterized protein n=1 Tax=Colocasia esculenta TaxID=4460 RepID=A0A843XGD5_COLES|nr:hypothetical protein [Colocasia esculenta]
MLFGSLWIMCVMVVVAFMRPVWFGCVVCAGLAQKFEMDDRRDWGGGGDDPEESTQRMIERIWESLTDIRRRSANGVASEGLEDPDEVEEDSSEVSEELDRSFLRG